MLVVMMPNDAFPLRKYTIPELLLGEGASAKVGGYARRLGASRVLLVTDPGLIRLGAAERVEQSLRDEGLACVIFDAVTPNPRDREVRSGVEVYHAEGCDLIVALGGGSPMDCAKGIGLSAANRRDILSFEGIDAVPEPGPPLVCIPTTAGSSADVSQFAIINDTARKIKIAIVSKKAIPDVALIDPCLTMTMPPELTAATGMDALVHAIEAYVSTASSALTDIDALEAIRLVGRHLAAAVADGADATPRAGMTLASLLAGRAFSNASLGAVHALAHALGGFLDLPHGVCNALLLGPVIAANYEASPERYNAVSRALAAGRDESCAPGLDGLLALVEDLRNAVGLGFGLSRLGLRHEDIPMLAAAARRDACLVTNPQRLDEAALEAILERAL